MLKLTSSGARAAPLIVYEAVRGHAWCETDTPSASQAPIGAREAFGALARPLLRRPLEAAAHGVRAELSAVVERSLELL